jgi:hypothetical protein
MEAVEGELLSGCLLGVMRTVFLLLAMDSLDLCQNEVKI